MTKRSTTNDKAAANKQNSTESEQLMEVSPLNL